MEYFYKNINIFQIGAGGTGGYLFPTLLKYIYSYAHLNPDKNFRYKLIDYDTVELKNIDRQNFLSSDIGQLKSEVLVNRYKRDYIFYPNVEVSYLDIEVCSNYVLSSYLAGNANDSLILVLGCVDNIDSRLIINETLYNMAQADTCEKYYKIIYLDSGNSINTGQVRVNTYKTRDDYESFINAFDNEKARAMDEITPTCSENGDQSIFANVRASDLLYTVASEIILHQKTGIRKVEFSRYMLSVDMDTNYQLEKGLM